MDTFYNSVFIFYQPFYLSCTAASGSWTKDLFIYYSFHNYTIYRNSPTLPVATQPDTRQVTFEFCLIFTIKYSF